MEPQKTFRDFYRALDIKTRRALGFSGFELAIAKAIEQYALNEEQLSKLIRLTTQVIVGFEKKEAFVSKISELLGVTPEISLSIASDINQKIINNIDNLYIERLLIDEEYLDDDEEVFMQDKIRKEIREYRSNMNPQGLIGALRGDTSAPPIGHIATFIKKSYLSIQKKVLSNRWVDKVSEISLKYSLTKENTNALISEVLLVLLDLEEGSNLVHNLQHEAGISEVLAEQLTEDINDRILNIPEKVLQTPPPEEPQETLDKKSLDIPPPNLPGEMIGEESVVPAPTLEQTSVPEIQVIPPQTLKDTRILTSQAGPTPQTTPTEAPKPSFIASKLTQTTKPTQPLPEIPKTYTIDPYREPIE